MKNGKRMFFMKAVFLLLIFLFGGCSDFKDSRLGKEGEPCFENDTCRGHLVCQDEVCVYPDESGADDDTEYPGNDESADSSEYSDDEKETDDFEVPDDTAEIAEMVTIPAGSFWMGCNEAVDSECQNIEKPYHIVTLSTYHIDKYPVTVAQYKACVEDGVCPLTGTEESCNYGAADKEDHPVNCVTWYDAATYCEWAGKRLPTEAEWEKAARGGCEFYINCEEESYKYPWGNTPAINCDHAVFYDLSYDDPGCGTGGTMPVGSKPLGVSPYGAYDMIGNVWEWVHDWYDEDYYENSPSEDPAGPETADSRVMRGGSWYSRFEYTLRSSSRGGLLPSNQLDFNGFRCAK